MRKVGLSEGVTGLILQLLSVKKDTLGIKNCPQMGWGVAQRTEVIVLGTNQVGNAAYWSGLFYWKLKSRCRKVTVGSCSKGRVPGRGGISLGPWWESKKVVERPGVDLQRRKLNRNQSPVQCELYPRENEESCLSEFASPPTPSLSSFILYCALDSSSPPKLTQHQAGDLGVLLRFCISLAWVVFYCFQLNPAPGGQLHKWNLGTC